MAEWGAAGFGAIIGWFVYYTNRYRKGDVQFSDITTLLGVIGGASVTALFGPASEQLFGAYGIGLFVGFFGYFVTLVILVRTSKGVFTSTWFLDGRRKMPTSEETIPDGRPPMAPMPSFAPQLPSAAPEIAPQVMAGPVLVGAAINPRAAQVIAACESLWETHKADCNAFVRAVADQFGVTGLVAPADKMVDTVAASWRVLDNGAAAQEAAAAGEFVIGGLRSDQHTPPRAHGHVVVVVAGALAFGKYPTAYWGSLAGSPYKNTTINWSWREADRDRVQFAARRI